VFEPAVREGYEWALPVNRADYDVFLELDGSTRAAGWRSILMELVTVDEHGTPLKPSDFPWLGSHVLIAREPAANLLAARYSQEIELLPLACDDATLLALNARVVVDALDEERSAPERFSSGRILSLGEPVFVPSRLEGLHIFKIPQMLRGATYVTGDFIKTMKQHGLDGIDFQPVWEDGTLDGP